MQDPISARTEYLLNTVEPSTMRNLVDMGLMCYRFAVQRRGSLRLYLRGEHVNRSHFIEPSLETALAIGCAIDPNTTCEFLWQLHICSPGVMQCDLNSFAFFVEQVGRFSQFQLLFWVGNTSNRINIINVCIVSVIAIIFIVFFLRRCFTRFVRQVSKSWVHYLQLKLILPWG